MKAQKLINNAKTIKSIVWIVTCSELRILYNVSEGSSRSAPAVVKFKQFLYVSKQFYKHVPTFSWCLDDGMDILLTVFQEITFFAV